MVSFFIKDRYDNIQISTHICDKNGRIQKIAISCCVFIDTHQKTGKLLLLIEQIFYIFKVNAFFKKIIPQKMSFEP